MTGLDVHRYALNRSKQMGFLENAYILGHILRKNYPSRHTVHSFLSVEAHHNFQSGIVQHQLYFACLPQRGGVVGDNVTSPDPHPSLIRAMLCKNMLKISKLRTFFCHVVHQKRHKICIMFLKGEKKKKKSPKIIPKALFFVSTLDQLAAYSEIQSLPSHTSTSFLFYRTTHIHTPPS